MPPPATAAAAARVKRREDDADADIRARDAPVLMEGPLRKQGARVHMWSPRYAVLRGSKLLMYRGTREEVAAVLRHPAAAGRADAASGSGVPGASGAADHQPPSPPLHKREFVLMPGCYVSEVRELPGAAGKGRSLWEFRLHWPEHVHHYGHGHGKGSLKPSTTTSSGTSSSSSRNKPAEETGAAELVDSDDDDDGFVDDVAADGEAVVMGPGGQPLQRVAGQTARTARAQQKRAQEIEQAEQAHQSLVSKGAALAGVVVGGVVIGALTAGVGLVPYLGLVGTAAVVSGGAVAYTAAQAPSSRVLLAAETESEALRWKGALELQVAVLEGRRPPPPPEIDLQDVDQLIRSTAWRSAGAIEGLRVLEEERGSKQRARAAALCRKMQTVLPAAPIKVFLAFMATEGPYLSAPAPTPAAAGTDEAGGAPPSSVSGMGMPPQLGPPTRRMAQSLRTVQQIDDHTDVVHVLLQPLPSPPPGATTGASFLPSANSYLGPFLLHPIQQRLVAPRDLCLLRYWRLDDDGVYTVCLTSVKHERCPEQPGMVRGALNGVLSIAPRKDYADFDDDLPEALVTYIVEVDPKGAVGAGVRADRVYRPLAGLSLRMSGHWRAGYADLVLSQILDVKEHLEHARFRHRDAAGHRRSSSLGSASASGGGPLGSSTGSGGATTSLGRLSLRARLYASSSRQRRKREKAEAAAALGAAASGGAPAGAGVRVGGGSPPRRGAAAGVAAGAGAAAAGGAAVVSAEEAARTQQVTAAALRARIAAKEYEVRRLEAELGRGGGNPLLMNVGAGAVLMASGSSTAAGALSSSQQQGALVMPAQPPQHRRDPSMDLLRQLQGHVDEAARLKAQYRAVTGKDYGGLSSSSSLSITTSVPSAPDAPTPDAAPASPTRQRLRGPLSPRRLMQRHHSHQQPPSSGHSPPRRVGAYGGDEGAGGDGMVGSPLAASAPAGPMRNTANEEEEEEAAFLPPASSSSRTRPSSSGGAVIDPFKWELGVPDHWFTRETGDGGRVTWDAVMARLFVVLVFCAMLFLTLSMRRLLALGVGVGGVSGAEAATEL